MENLLLQTKEYVKELMVYRFKSVIPSLEKTDNFPILVNDFMDKGILLWLWILPDGRDGAVRIGNGLAFSHLTHHALAGLGESHHGRGGPVALRIGDDHSLAALHDGHTAICRT